MLRKKSTRVDATPRVMWILNHTAARKFEVPMLRDLGYEVFTPKLYPNDPHFRSASTDFSEDANLTIPPVALEALNQANWYEGANGAAWELANKYFDLAFFFLFNLKGVEKLCRRFNGELLWRTYGLASDYTYSGMLEREPLYLGTKTVLRHSRQRFWFAEAYDHLHEVESDWIQRKAVYLPLGMAGASRKDDDTWTGGDKRILFVCPDIGFNVAYTEIYEEFRTEFRGFPYVVGGAQSVQISDPKVLGYLPLEEHLQNMRRMQLMFYHSREPRHIHFHPFEAVKAGMPLVFMAGGMLDKIGGKDLPGRARNWDEAREKVRRLLNGDSDFCEQVRSSQTVLLESMKAENLVHHWADGLRKIQVAAKERRVEERHEVRRIAFLVAPEHQQWAVGIAHGMLREAENAGQSIKMTIGVEAPEASRRSVSSQKEASSESSALPQELERTDLPTRIFRWQEISRAQAERSLTYAGAEKGLFGKILLVPDDQINYFQDCDVWVVVGGGKPHPVLPMKPLVVVIRDYPATYAMPGDIGAVKPARLGFVPAPEAVVTFDEDTKARVIKMEGMDSAIVHIVDDNVASADLLNVVLECL